MNNCKKEDIELKLDYQKVNDTTEAKSINDFFNDFDIGKNDFDIGKIDEFMKSLISDYCLCVNGVEYRFCEIELYFSAENHRDCSVFPRGKKDAGDIFFHYDGFDICFKSDCENQYGGVLVRSLKQTSEQCNKSNKDGGFVIGPLKCLREILNHGKKGNINIQIIHKHNGDITVCKSRRIKGVSPNKCRCEKNTYSHSASINNAKYRYFTEELHDRICSRVDSNEYKKKHLHALGENENCK